MITAATTHATDIQSPPDTIQSTLSKKDQNDIGKILTDCVVSSAARDLGIETVFSSHLRENCHAAKSLGSACKYCHNRPDAKPAGRLSWLNPSLNRNVKPATGHSRLRHSTRSSAARSPASRLRKRCRRRCLPRSLRLFSTMS